MKKTMIIAFALCLSIGRSFELEWFRSVDDGSFRLLAVSMFVMVGSRMMVNYSDIAV